MMEHLSENPAFVCPSCHNVFENPMIEPNIGVTLCQKCWGVNGYSSRHWANIPLDDQMFDAKLVWKHENRELSTSDMDWQNHVALGLVQAQDWTNLLENLATISRPDWSVWKGQSKYILVEACKNPCCPEEVIESLLMNGHVNQFTPLPCINPGGIGAMTPERVSAKFGNLNALRVFLRLWPDHGWKWDASLSAFYANQKEALDFLWDSYASEGQDLGKTLRNKFNFLYLRTEGKNQDLDASMEIVRKYDYPNRQ